MDGDGLSRELTENDTNPSPHSPGSKPDNQSNNPRRKAFEQLHGGEGGGAPARGTPPRIDSPPPPDSGGPLREPPTPPRQENT